MKDLLTFSGSQASSGQTGTATSRRQHFLESNFQSPLWGVGSLQFPDTPFVNMKTLPTAEYIRECLDYDPETGVMVWKKRPRHHFTSDDRWAAINTRRAGRPAGCPGHLGYVTVGISGTKYFAHRLAWLFITGRWPKETIDHINGDPSDNRASNLWEASQWENKRNTKRRKDNTVGAKGVWYDRSRGKWRTYLNTQNKRTYLGGF